VKEEGGSIRRRMILAIRATTADIHTWMEESGDVISDKLIKITERKLCSTCSELGKLLTMDSENQQG
jgi:hypothetical protein